MRIMGDFTADILASLDGLGLWDVDKLSIKADSDAEFLLMEVPMK
jgi:hypothetical protein